MLVADCESVAHFLKVSQKTKPSGLPDNNFIFFVTTKKTKQKKTYLLAEGISFANVQCFYCQFKHNKPALFFAGLTALLSISKEIKSIHSVKLTRSCHDRRINRQRGPHCMGPAEVMFLSS